MKLNIKITTNAGDQATYTAQPPEWRKWEIETGQKISKDPSLGISDLMFVKLLVSGTFNYKDIIMLRNLENLETNI